MEQLNLRKIALEDEASFIKALMKWQHSSDFDFIKGFSPDCKFAEYLERLDKMEKGIDLPPGIVPETSLFGFVGSEIVGRVSLRHELNDFLLKIGGHIGYGVIEEHRQKGYATEMLRQSLKVCKKLKINKVLVTCTDGNIASEKTILKCGGVYENTEISDRDQVPKKRFWISLNTGS